MRDLREKDWFWLDNGIVDREDLSIYEKMLYICLARHSNNTTGYAFPSNKTLCKELGIKDERTVQKYTKVLEEKGLVSIEKKRGTSNRYYLKNCIVDTSDVGTFNNTIHTKCDKVPTSDAKSTYMGCGSNKTITRLNNIMIHNTHDLFENIFKTLDINFTTTNQKSVAKLLKTQSVEEVKTYILETYSNLKDNPDIKNLSGIFSSKIAKGERQVQFKKPVNQTPKEPSPNKEKVIQVMDKKTTEHLTKQEADLNNLENRNQERTKLDIFFNSLPANIQEEIIRNSIELAKKENKVDDRVAKVIARQSTKYKILRTLYDNEVKYCG